MKGFTPLPKVCQGGAESGGPVYSDDQSEFLAAVDKWLAKARRFPTNCEVLEILKGLGYVKGAKPNG